MGFEDVAVQEASTARGNTLTVLVDLVEGRAQPVERGQLARDALRAASLKPDNVRFEASSAA